MSFKAHFLVLLVLGIVFLTFFINNARTGAFASGVQPALVAATVAGEDILSKISAEDGAYAELAVPANSTLELNLVANQTNFSVTVSWLANGTAFADFYYSENATFLPAPGCANISPLTILEPASEEKASGKKDKVEKEDEKDKEGNETDAAEPEPGNETNAVLPESVNETVANETPANETIANETAANETLENQTNTTPHNETNSQIPAILVFSKYACSFEFASQDVKIVFSNPSNETTLVFLDHISLAAAQPQNETTANKTVSNETFENQTLTNTTQLNSTLENQSFQNQTLENLTNNPLENETLENNSNQTQPRDFSVIDVFPTQSTNASIPSDWFARPSIGEGESNWTWNPFKKNAFFLNFSRMFFEQGGYDSPYVRVFSNPVASNVSKFNVSFEYKPFFSGKQLQLGTEVLFSDSSGDTTLIANFDETGQYDSTDFSCTTQTGEWILTNCKNDIPLPENRTLILYFAPINKDGYVFLNNISFLVEVG